jgi:voltage-gated potassium channel
MPALAAYAAIQALLAIFSKQWQMLMIRFYRNHVVVCGLGERGLRLAKDFSQHGYRVVVIEGVKDNNLVELCRKQGM